MSSDRLTALSRRAFPALAWIFVACLVIQLFLVGLDVFAVVGPDSTIHRTFAYAYGWLSAGLVLVAVAARLEATRLRWTVLLLVLFALQTYLPSLAQRAPVVAAFHAVNALAVFWLALHVARHGADPVEPAPSHGG
jgi:Family of unknown function (DUF6220)